MRASHGYVRFDLEQEIKTTGVLTDCNTFVAEDAVDCTEGCVRGILIVAELSCRRANCICLLNKFELTWMALYPDRSHICA